ALAIWFQQRLDCAAFVHCTVALCHLIQGQSQVENLAGVDLPVLHKIDEFRQVTPHRSGPAVQVHVSEEQLLTVERNTVWHADVAYITTGTRRLDCLHHRLLCPNTFKRRIRTERSEERRVGKEWRAKR